MQPGVLRRTRMLEPFGWPGGIGAQPIRVAPGMETVEAVIAQTKINTSTVNSVVTRRDSPERTWITPSSTQLNRVVMAAV